MGRRNVHGFVHGFVLLLVELLGPKGTRVVVNRDLKSRRNLQFLLGRYIAYGRAHCPECLPSEEAKVSLRHIALESFDVLEVSLGTEVQIRDSALMSSLLSDVHSLILILTRPNL